MTGGLKVGDRVNTPMGVGTIDEIRTDREWIFGRPRRLEPLLFIRYRSGKRHPWTPANVKPV